MVDILKGTWFYGMFIALVLYVHILAARGRAMSLMTPVMSKMLSSPTPKFADLPLIFECQFVGTPNANNTQKVPGINVRPFLLYKS